MVIGIFVDGANIHKLGVRFNFEDFMEWIAQGRDVGEAYYFTGKSIYENKKLEEVYKHVRMAGFKLELREAAFINATNQYKQGGCDAALIIKAMYRGIIGHFFDTFILVSGDSDFMPLLEEMDTNGIEVEIISNFSQCHHSYRQSKFKLRYMDEFLKTVGVKQLE